MVHVMILAGGSGTRLWPLSRRGMPKFLLDCGAGEPLILNAVRRALAVTSPEYVHIVTTAGYVDATAATTSSLGVTSLIVEPVGKDTAAAVTLGAEAIRQLDPQAMVISMAADQVVPNDDVWASAVKKLISSTAQGNIACIGLMPEAPETGFGYIYAPGAEKHPDLPTVARGFHEKPDKMTATRYVEGGEHLWNSGIMAWRSESFDELMTCYAPAIIEAARRLLSGDQAAWRRVVRDPIEPVLLAPAAAAGRLVVLPTALRWRDIGSWPALAQVAPSRQDQVLSYNSSGCSVIGDRASLRRRYVFAEVQDLIVIECEDVVLVIGQNASQSVKQVVEVLKEKGWTDLL